MGPHKNLKTKIALLCPFVCFCFCRRAFVSLFVFAVSNFAFAGFATNFLEFLEFSRISISEYCIIGYFFILYIESTYVNKIDELGISLYTLNLRSTSKVCKFSSFLLTKTLFIRSLQPFPFESISEFENSVF